MEDCQQGGNIVFKKFLFDEDLIQHSYWIYFSDFIKDLEADSSSLKHPVTFHIKDYRVTELPSW